jgi:hypothetical protein
MLTTIRPSARYAAPYDAVGGSMGASRNIFLGDNTVFFTAYTAALVPQSWIDRRALPLVS